MRLPALIGLLAWATVVQGQIRHPAASPAQTLVQEVGLCTLSVSYSRPAVRGREIFGGLVPYGRIWRVGANQSTKFRTDCTLSLDGTEIPAGTYALYAFPRADSWEVVIHRDTTHWGDGRDAYDPADDLLRFRVQPERTAGAQENFRIGFDSISHDGLQMIWHWDRTLIRIPMRVDTRAAMEAEITRALAENPTAQTYYEAARYLQESGIDTARALGYTARALELGGDTYYFYRVRSLLLAASGNYREAVQAASRSRDLAEREGKDEFVRMNELNIREWNAILQKSGTPD